MKYILFIFCVFVNSRSIAQSSSDPLNVLFVGNSLTYFNSMFYYNDMPLSFKAIAEDQGLHINVDHHSVGSAGFNDHLGNTELYTKLDGTVWDYVILQPGTSESLEVSQSLSITISQGEQLMNKIFENSPCASIYLYEIAYGITGSTPIELQEFISTQEIIRNNLIQISNQLELPLAPVGESFVTAYQQNAALFLWENYGDIHPNEKGSFLAAVTFYNAMFQKPIVDSNFNSTLDESEADYLRSISESVTLNNLDIWNIDTLTANPNFTFSSTDGTSVSFNNTSTNYNTVFWNFGDGSTSTEIHPTHVFDFSSQDSYQVYLTAYLGCKESHFVQTVSQSSLSTLFIDQPDDFNVYPNPAISNLYMISNTGVEFCYALFDLFGKRIHSESKLRSKHVINTSKFPKGIYFLVLESHAKNDCLKIIKN